MPIDHYTIDHIARTFGYEPQQIIAALKELGEEPSLSIDSKPFFCRGSAERVWAHLASQGILPPGYPPRLSETAADADAPELAPHEG